MMPRDLLIGPRSIALFLSAFLLPVSCTSARSGPTGGSTSAAGSAISSPVEVLGGLSPAEPMAVPRAVHTATRLSDGRVLIAGGFDDEGGNESSAELFDPVAGEFSPTGSMSTSRNSQTATLLRDGRVLIVGGTGAGYSFLASVLLYDPTTGTFTPTGRMSVPRESATATPISGGRVLIAGGHAGRHEAIRIYASAEVYDVATGTFASVGDMTIPRHKHDAVRLRDGRVLIVGGSDERDDAGLYRSAEIFDPRTNTFHATGRLHEGRYKMRGTSVRLADGRLLVCCGADRAELFDPSSGVFRRIAGSFGSSPLFAAAVRIGPEELLVTGGYSLTGPATAETWIIQL